jgi:L-ascorbate metabolism protein UlaG (beta-lactamase superfamily)
LACYNKNMKITKYEHACMVLEEQGERLVIDPGAFTPSFGAADGVTAVVVTHAHPDHFSPGHLQKIVDNNPDVRIFTTEEAARNFQKPNITVVHDGDEHTAGPFALHFTGNMHAVIHPDWPYPRNTGVRVGDAFYYGGDSFTPPGQPVRVLAVPSSAPWMKISEAMDYVASVKPKRCFPTHNALLSESGQAVANKWLGEICEKEGIGFTFLKPGGSIEE